MNKRQQLKNKKWSHHEKNWKFFMVRSMFPGLFEVGVVSESFGDAIVVVKSHVADNCIIIKARKPLEFLMRYLAAQDFTPTWCDSVETRYNTDGSLSVWDL